MVDTLNFVEGEGISIQTGPNPGDPDVLDIEIANTAPETGGGTTTTTMFYEQTTAPAGAALGAVWVDTDG